MNSNIVFIGFPDSTLVKILALCKQKGFAVNKSEKLITIELITKKEGFEKWKNEITTVIKPDGKKARPLQTYTLSSHTKSPPPKPKLVNKYASPTAPRQETPSC